MGRASRQKRQRGQRRWVTTKNPWTGQRERFEIAISGRGFREWERDRVLLASRGYPDRPPETDTANLRGWSVKPDDSSAADECHEGSELGAYMGPGANFHGIWQTTSGLPCAKLIVGRRDRDWLLHLIVEDGTSVLLEDFGLVPGEADAAVIDDLCRRELARFNQSAPRWSGGDELVREAMSAMKERA